MEVQAEMPIRASAGRPRYAVAVNGKGVCRGNKIHENNRKRGPRGEDTFPRDGSGYRQHLSAYGYVERGGAGIYLDVRGSI